MKGSVTDCIEANYDRGYERDGLYQKNYYRGYKRVSSQINKAKLL